MITGIRGLLHFSFTPCRKNIHDPPAGYLSNVITARKRRLCLHRCLSVHCGERAWQGACMGALGHVWRGACVVGGMHSRGAFVAEGGVRATADTTGYGQ